uniref:Putative protease n=1 Tax=Podoviridae sp. ctOAf25 TaxID=2825245 RepID=A0A8S5PQ53_9CAUD|nr:MAG TPA: putative protease [Podoviridae sp. ctOAf25]
MAEELEQGTNDNTMSAESGKPQDTNTQEQQGTILGGGTDTSGNQEPPAEPVVYDFTKAFESGEVDQTIADEFSKMLNGVGATQEQAVELAKFGNKYATDLVTAYEAKRQEALVEQYNNYVEHTKEVLGNKYDETVAKAGAGVEVVEKSIPNIREILAENGLGNRVELIQLFAQIAGMAGEDSNTSNSKPATEITTEQELANRIYKDM